MLRASLQAPPKRLIGDYCGAERFRRAHPARCAQSIVIAGASVIPGRCTDLGFTRDQQAS
jgi:hypothetical protein